MSDIQLQFEQFNRENPGIFTLLLRFTNEVREKGYQNYSVGAVFERIRWHINVETRSEDEFKLNNNFRSRYVRLLEQRHPNLAGFYRKRRLRS